MLYAVVEFWVSFCVCQSPDTAVFYWLCFFILFYVYSYYSWRRHFHFVLPAVKPPDALMFPDYFFLYASVCNFRQQHIYAGKSGTVYYRGDMDMEYFWAPLTDSSIPRQLSVWFPYLYLHVLMPLGSCRPLMASLDWLSSRDVHRQLPLAEGGGITAPDFPVTGSRWLKMSSGVEKALETSSVLTVSHQQRAAKSKSKSKTTDRKPGSAGNADGESHPPPPSSTVWTARVAAPS